MAGLAGTMSVVGRFALAIGVGGMGVLCLIYAGLDPQWQNPPENLNSAVLAYANGAVLIAASAALLIPQAAKVGGYALAAFLALWMVALNAPRVLAGEEAAWLAPAEVGAVAIGAWLASGSNLLPKQALHGLFALCLITFGIAHFLYLEFTAQMIPAFIPFHLPLAAITGGGHVAAGLSIITGVLAWLGAALLGLMFTLFVVLLHIPRVLADPANRIEWTMLTHATALTGAAWLVAADILKARTKA